MAPRKSTTKGFKLTASVLSDRIRRAGESRGFAVSRLLTHWEEIAGPQIAAVARPVRIGYGRGGFGATLTVLTTGPQAPMLEMQKEKLREKVNAVYGYNAISRVSITQTAPEGFSEGQIQLRPPRNRNRGGPDPAATGKATELADGIGDDRLRAALERLGGNVLSRHNRH